MRFFALSRASSVSLAWSGAKRSLIVRYGRHREARFRHVGRPPLPDDELVADIKAVIAELPTYGYRRVHAILRRQALAAGRNPPNHKRVYRVMKGGGWRGSRGCLRAAD